MEEKITDDSLFTSIIDILWLYVWVGIAVFGAFALANLNIAIVLTLLLLVIVRAFELLYATINNKAIDLQCAGYRNILVLALHMKRDDNDLDQAFRDADATISKYPTPPKPGFLQNALGGFASEAIWFGICGYLGWRSGPALMTALVPFMG